ncbi:methyltransferase domain-containing protein [Streptomyces aidingensis]|uniref:Protein-L-isoaspartate O-methyltransferase n=1 Tax=Streptomyces aidingensis TaxID=910347 RepID=A0A1I1RGN9_9ACTN|nr:methyltransferase domain-containing protein [Streptomyces aidingensis]SFD33471.1 protein-L-isoaspartate(D-aspartate) O-methyltransferase [Streptomyces aidingensis]
MKQGAETERRTSTPAGAAAEIERTAERLRKELAAALEDAGDLPDPAWRAAFRAVPRHLFVPYYYDPSGLKISREQRPGLWLRGVHSDNALVTRRFGGEPTSSSSQPSLMAEMLHQLETADGQRVLEIGTGTGYNAALLAHRLGDTNVTSIDITPELTAAARAHLAEAGYHPTVITGDGALGWPEKAPYHRIIATCRVDTVPLPWLRQLTRDGLMVAPLGNAVARLRRTGADEAEGRFLAGAWFMPLRATASATAVGRPPVTAPPAEPGPADARRTALGAAAVDDDDFRFLLSLVEPDLDWRRDPDPEGDSPTLVCLRAADGSIARLHRAGRVEEAGPRRLWARLEELHDVWTAAGRPGPRRFGITVDGPYQTLWTDSPDGPSWLLPHR